MATKRGTQGNGNKAGDANKWQYTRAKQGNGKKTGKQGNGNKAWETRQW